MLLEPSVADAETSPAPDVKARRARGLTALALFLGLVGGLSFYSGAAGLSDSIAFVREREEKLPMLSGPLGSFASFVPAGSSFGFYAPQVCAEFKLTMRLGNTKTGEVRQVSMRLGPEAEMLVASLSSAAQDDVAAKAIASTYASYGFTRYRTFDSAEVKLHVEAMPPLEEAGLPSVWVPISTFYIKR